MRKIALDPVASTSTSQETGMKEGDAMMADDTGNVKEENTGAHNQVPCPDQSY